MLPTVDGGIVPAFEIMHLNNAVRTLVRDSRIHQIDSVIQTSAAEGMIGMDESILHHAMNPDQLQKKLGRQPHAASAAKGYCQNERETDMGKNKWAMLLCLAFMAVCLTGCGQLSANKNGNGTNTGVLTTIDKARTGDTVKFGSYEQDGDTQNGPEEIEWIVLDIDGDKLLLLSKYVLDAAAYCDTPSGCGWENSVLYGFLNTDFLNSAFSDAERETMTTGILYGQFDEDLIPYQTREKVFVLSEDELDYYYEQYDIDLFAALPTDAAKQLEITLYSNENRPEYEGMAYFWMRSDHIFGCVMAPTSTGWVITKYNGPSEDGVRPAIWISRNS